MFDEMEEKANREAAMQSREDERSDSEQEMEQPSEIAE